MQPEELLFTDREGTRTSLQDVIYSGLDYDYSARYPALLHLMREGEPAHRLYACVMLVSWGVPEGFQMLIEWARDPDATPWAAQPVTYDRFFGADSSFEMLAEAVQVAGDLEGREDLDALRVDAVRALLGIYERVYFARSLMVLLDLDRELAASVKDDIVLAVEWAIVAARDPSVPFDMPTQAAFLMCSLAALDDAHAARAAEVLLAEHAENARTVREVAYALGWGTGPATGEILQRLTASQFAEVRKDAQESLSRRAAAGA